MTLAVTWTKMGPTATTICYQNSASVILRFSKSELCSIFFHIALKFEKKVQFWACGVKKIFGKKVDLGHEVQVILWSHYLDSTHTIFAFLDNCDYHTYLNFWHFRKIVFLRIESEKFCRAFKIKNPINFLHFNEKEIKNRPKLRIKKL